MAKILDRTGALGLARTIVREQLALAPRIEYVAHGSGSGLPSGIEHLLEGRNRAFPDLGPRERHVAGPAHLQDDFLGRFLAGAGHVETARRDCRDTERVPQHVIYDVVVRVIKLQPAAAPGSVVGSQGQMQQLVRKNEYQIVIG